MSGNQSKSFVSTAPDVLSSRLYHCGELLYQYVGNELFNQFLEYAALTHYDENVLDSYCSDLLLYLELIDICFDMVSDPVEYYGNDRLVDIFNNIRRLVIEYALPHFHEFIKDDLSAMTSLPFGSSAYREYYEELCNLIRDYKVLLELAV